MVFKPGGLPFLLVVTCLAAQAAVAASRIIVDCPTLTVSAATNMSAKFYNDSVPLCGLACNATVNDTAVPCALRSCDDYMHDFYAITTAPGDYNVVFYNESTNATCRFTKPATRRPSAPDAAPPAVALAALAALLFLRKSRQRY